ncbi:MAG: cell division protein ZapE [Actinomycetia bacterium]|nr:cell division protein ZapE [Actinomycetes bacterium]
MSTVRLVDRFPQVKTAALVATLVPPPLFAQVDFDSYFPDPLQPTQAAAVAALRAFSTRIASPEGERSWWRRAPAPPEGRAGAYLDGGFGVGKTHLLAALWHNVPGPKLFGTFVELTNLVGAIGFADAVERLARHRLICIDEFELDDPGDTVLMATLLQRLTEQGVMLATTSNTLPDRLGEDRFAAADFLREIQGLAAHFDVLRIEGPDYRHRDATTTPEPATEAELQQAIESGGAAAADEFDALLEHLAALHPSRYGALVSGIDVAVWRDVHAMTDQAVALRFVVLVDRLYDRGVRVVSSGSPLGDVFSAEMLAGGYRKKYFRALSRLVTLAQPR